MKLQGTSSHHLYKVDNFVPFGVLRECAPVGYHVSLDTWYERFSHLSYATIKSVLHNCDPMIPFSSIASIIDKVCPSYQLAKSYKLPFVTSHTRMDKIFQLLYLDLWTTSKHVTYIDRYFLSIINDHSLFTWVYCLQSKDQTN